MFSHVKVNDEVTQDAFAWLEDRAYQAFKAGGKPEAYEKFQAKWKARKLEEAAAKAKPADPEVAA